MIAGKEKKLSNENFVQRAPEAGVLRERQGLDELKQKLVSTREALERLRNG